MPSPTTSSSRSPRSTTVDRDRAQSDRAGDRPARRRGPRRKSGRGAPLLADGAPAVRDAGRRLRRVRELRQRDRRPGRRDRGEQPAVDRLLPARVRAVARAVADVARSRRRRPQHRRRPAHAGGRRSRSRCPTSGGAHTRSSRTHSSSSSPGTTTTAAAPPSRARPPPSPPAGCCSPCSSRCSRPGIPGLPSVYAGLGQLQALLGQGAAAQRMVGSGLAAPRRRQAGDRRGRADRCCRNSLPSRRSPSRGTPPMSSESSQRAQARPVRRASASAGVAGASPAPGPGGGRSCAAWRAASRAA